jgi:parallel beta-helix repeat protein
MCRKLALVMIFVVFMGILTLAFNIQPVEASSTIYIRADGSIDPPTAPISTLDNVTYTFTGDINDSVVIERDNIVVDGVGYVLQGTGSGAGIDITERSNVTIKNTQIKTFEFGIRLWQSSNDTISLNNIENNGYGILLGLSSNNTLSSNLMNSNRINFGVYGSELYHFFHSVDTSNLVDDKPIYYWVNRYGVEIPSDAGYVALVNCTEITIRNLTLTHNRQGLLLVNTQNSYITNNNLTSNGDGIFVYQSSNNIIYGNNIAANKYYGIYLKHFSNYNSISGNNITSNGCGIWLWFSSNNTISGNNIMTHDWEGIFIWSFSNYNTISGNTLINNFCGIWVADSLSISIIYHNNFINNLEQVTIPDSGYANRWDDGYPSGGNYWSDYNGIDVNEDGIGDTSYVINEENKDNYPLMVPYITAAQMRVLYYDLLEKFNDLLARYNLLNQTYEGLLGNITNLKEQVDSLNSTCSIVQTSIGSWQQQVDLLNLTLQISINELQSQIDSLNSTLISGQKAIVDELANIRNLMYVFTAATVVLIATMVYFAKRKPKKEP